MRFFTVLGALRVLRFDFIFDFSNDSRALSGDPEPSNGSVSRSPIPLDAELERAAWRSSRLVRRELGRSILANCDGTLTPPLVSHKLQVHDEFRKHPLGF